MSDSAPHEPVYRMGQGELVPESGMKAWHNDRGIPWGTPYEGPDPVTIRKMREPRDVAVHLGWEHDIDAGRYTVAGQYYEHQDAHVHARFREGQEHYHEVVNHKSMAAHDGYVEHSHEVRADHHGVPRREGS